jgi:hypothetical protein
MRSESDDVELQAGRFLEAVDRWPYKDQRSALALNDHAGSLFRTPGGRRTWWAHFEFTRMNTGSTQKVLE